MGMLCSVRKVIHITQHCEYKMMIQFSLSIGTSKILVKEF